MKNSKALFVLFLGVIIGSLLSSFLISPRAAAQSGAVSMLVFTGRTNENGRAQIPHNLTGECEDFKIVGMTAGIRNNTNDNYFVPGDNEWAEGRSFMAWDDEKFTIEIDEESGWYSNQNVYVVAFIQPVIC